MDDEGSIGTGRPSEGEDGSDGDAIVAFWELARRRVGLGRLGVIVGPSALESVPPPAWGFGDSPELADELLALVLEGTKTATASAFWEYDAESEPLPGVGDLSILLDGSGHPRALVRTTDVQVTAFSAVDAEHARLEGEGDGSLESWRTDHRAAFGCRLTADGAPFDEDLPVVLERFELCFPRGPHHVPRPTHDGPDPEQPGRSG